MGKGLIVIELKYKMEISKLFDKYNKICIIIDKSIFVRGYNEYCKKNKNNNK